MQTLSFTKLLKNKGLTSIYPNNIPSGVNGEKATGVYLYSNTMNRYNTSGTVSLQFITTSIDLNECELKSNQILDWLLNSNVEGEVIDDCEILSLQVLNLSPMYIGIDAEKRYRWSFNIELTLKKFN